MTKLNKNLVALIVGDFHLNGYSTRQLADDYGVSQRQIQKIVKGEIWQEAYDQAMKIVSINKKAMEKEQAEITEPTIVKNTYKGNNPFEVMSFVDGDETERRGVFIDADAIHDGLLGAFTPTQLKSLLAIFAHVDKNNEAFPSQERIAKLTGMSKSTVNKNVQALDYGVEVEDYWTGEILDGAVNNFEALHIEKVPAKNNPYEMSIYNFSKALIKYRDIMNSSELTDRLEFSSKSMDDQKDYLLKSLLN